MNLVSVIGRLGIDLLALKNASILFSEARVLDLQTLFSTCLISSIGTTGIICLLFLLAGSAFPALLPQGEGIKNILVLFLISAPLFAFLNVTCELLKGMRLNVIANFLQGCIIPVGVLVTVVSLSSVVVITSSRVAGLYLVVTLLAASLAWLAFSRTTSLNKVSTSMSNIRDLAASSMPLYLIACSSVVISWADTVLLGLFRDVDEVGIYNGAARTALLLSFLLVAMNSVVTPKLASYYNQGRFTDMRKLMQMSTFLMCLAALPISLVFVMAGESILTIFGTEFVKGYNVLLILVVGQLINIIAGPSGHLLIVTGNQALVRNSFLLGAICSIFFSVVLIPSYGATGAAIATSLGLLFSNLASVTYVYRRLGFFPVGNFSTDVEDT